MDEITIVDLGNYNTKYSGQDTGIFSSRSSTDFRAYEDVLNRINIDGLTTYIGIGELDKEYTKSNRNIKPVLLYAIAQAHKNQETIETKLTTLLPINQMRSKSKLIEEFENKIFQVEVDGEKKNIKINDMIVLPEGYVSYFSLTPEQRKLDICIIDIGSRTTNIITIIKGKLEKSTTIKIGSLDFYTKIKNKYGGDTVEEEVERLIESGFIDVEEQMYVDFFCELKNAIKPTVDVSKYHTFFTGGTSLIFKDMIKSTMPKTCNLHPNPVTSNLEGAKIASENIWRKKNEA